MGKEKPGYWAVLPASVRYDETLPANAKLLYAELSALAQVDGYCWASNQHLGELFGVDKKTVSRLISMLADRGYIRVDVERNDAGQVVRRKVFTGLFSVTPIGEENEPETDTPSPQNCGYPSPQCGDPSPQNCGDPSPQNCGGLIKYNNTSIEHTPLPPKRKYPKDVCDVMKDYCGNDLALVRAMEAFLDNRIALGKPMKTKRAASTLTNRLEKLSGGDNALKVMLLDEATLHNWLSVYVCDRSGQSGAAARLSDTPLRGEGVTYL